MLYPFKILNMELAMLITMLASIGSLIALILDKLRKSRCVKIKSCCCEIERELDDNQTPEST